MENRRFSLAAIVLVACNLVACNALSVHKDKPNGVWKHKSLKGVPFYVKKGHVDQTTVYTRTWVEVHVSLLVLMPDGKPMPGTTREAVFNLTPSTFDQEKLWRAFASARDQVPTGIKLDQQFAVFQSAFAAEIDSEWNANPVIDAAELQTDALPVPMTHYLLQETLLSYAATPGVHVDYSTPLYFNANVPPFGTATATVKLHADGTLTEATGTVDATKAADIIPLKSLLIDKWGLEAIAGGEKVMAAPDTATEVWQLSARESGYRYTLTKRVPYTDRVATVKLDFDTDNVQIARTALADTPEQPKPGDKNTVQFGGTVKLPE